MVGTWIDMGVVLVLVFGLLKGFRQGLVREVFSLAGAVLAVAVAYQGYQELSVRLTEWYPLAQWQAQLAAFTILILGIALVATGFGFLWSRIIRLTPFAFVDHIAGAGFGVAKVLVMVVVVVALLSSLSLPPVDQLLEESNVAQQVMLLLPLVHQRLETVWPDDWPRPGWLFPDRVWYEV